MLEQHGEVGSTANSYAIIAKLATGGMADIFLARTESAAGVERYVVLKRVLRHRATDIKFVHMFIDEARLAAQLQHPNIAQVFDTGRLGDSYFFTMEYVHGETVRELLYRAYGTGQKVPIACALTIAAGAAAGLQHAHERVGLDGKPLGIVHRDVSPSNLMISYEGNVKLVDFGVAKASLNSTETQSGTVKGKIGYMAPEQCRGGRVDLRCDLFSLGIVLWELLTGDRLFKRATEYESMEAIVLEPSPPPSSRRPEIPPSIDAITLKLLAKDPAARYGSAEEVLEAIENAAVSAGIALSVPALRRFVRELFGQRPEPWVDLRLREGAAEVVTVTGLPVGKQDAAELQLDRVPDLSTTSVPAVEGSNQSSPGAEAPVLFPAPQPRAPTAPTVSGPVVAIARETSASQSGSLAVATRSSSLVVTSPQAMPSADAAPFAAVGSSASYIEPEPEAVPRRRSWAVILVTALAAIAVGTGIAVVAFKVTRGNPPTASAPGVTSGSANNAAAIPDEPANPVAKEPAVKEPEKEPAVKEPAKEPAVKEPAVKEPAKVPPVEVKREPTPRVTVKRDPPPPPPKRDLQPPKKDPPPPKRDLQPPKKDPPPPPKKDPPPPPKKDPPPPPPCDPADPMSCRR